MAAPTFTDQSHFATSLTTGGNVTWPEGHQPDDIGVLIVETANETVATPSGWTALGNVGTGTAGVAGSVALWVFWKRATSAAEADAVVADAGDHIRARIFGFRGCETSGSPFDGSVVTGTVATPQTAVSIANPTTTVDECLVVSVVGNATDSTSNQTTAGSWANSGLTGFTRIFSGTHTIGVGGGYDGGAGVKDVAGAVGNSTATLATASAQAKIAFALKPPQGAPPATTPTEGGIYVATGAKAAIGATGATTATLDTAAIQARITIALKPEVAAPANSAPILQNIPAIVAAVGNLINVPINVSDPDGDVVTLSLVDSATPVPTGATLVEDESSGNFSIEWTPTSDQAGEWSFILRATDDDVSPLSTDVIVSILVRPGRTNPFGGGVSSGLNSIV